MPNCKVCRKKKTSGKFRYISFIHGGLKFKTLKNKDVCHTCAVKDEIERFEKYGKDLVELLFGKIHVDCELYIKPYRETDSVWDEHSKLTLILLSLGILCWSPKGNWAIITLNGTNMLNESPDIYFTRKEDAIEVAKLAFSNAHFDWYIQKVDELFSKK